MDEHANRMPKDSSELGHSTRGRPVTERVTLVNMGNRPHRDNGEEVAPATSLPSYQLVRTCSQGVALGFVVMPLRGSARRPAQRTAAQNVHVQVRH